MGAEAGGAGFQMSKIGSRRHPQTWMKRVSPLGLEQIDKKAALSDFVPPCGTFHVPAELDRVLMCSVWRRQS
jgi:hypothetical protein